jgi:predicted dehydrogenase
VSQETKDSLSARIAPLNNKFNNDIINSMISDKSHSILNVGILGYGYWGTNLLRNFINVYMSGGGVNVKYVADLSSQRLSMAKSLYPAIETTTNVNDVFNDSTVDAVVIALPVSLHYEMAKKALNVGKHVLVEKPMTDSADTSAELIELVQKKKKVLMCDHTFLYTGAVKKIKQLIQDKHLGNLQYFDSVRINLGLFQSDVNVVWDLAPHDISILSYIYSDNPCGISATGYSHTNNAIENIAYLTLFYQSGFIAHISVSWISPVKIRKILIGGEKKMIVYDDIEPTEKVKIYDSGYNITSYDEENKFKIDYRIGDIFTPKLDATEALKGMVADFISAIINGTVPASNSELGYNVVKILDASVQSIKQNGKLVRI